MADVDFRLGDCRQMLGTLPDDSVDLVFTDPPYGTTDIPLDKDFRRIDWAALSTELQRVLKPAGWAFWFFPGRHVGLISQHWQYRFEYCCVKPRGFEGHRTVRPLYSHELLWAFCQPELKRVNDLYFDRESLRTTGEPYKHCAAQGRTEYRDGMRAADEKEPHTNSGYREGTTVLYMRPKSIQPSRERTPHPTQKPLDLCRTIVRGYCPEGGTVLDPFAGSGTHLLAAVGLGRRAVGFEVEPRYYQMARVRLDGRLDGGLYG